MCVCVCVCVCVNVGFVLYIYIYIYIYTCCIHIRTFTDTHTILSEYRHNIADAFTLILLRQLKYNEKCKGSMEYKNKIEINIADEFMHDSKLRTDIQIINRILLITNIALSLNQSIHRSH